MFQIQKRRYYQYEPFYPQIKGKLGTNNEIIDTLILPSTNGSILFGLLWIIMPILVFNIDHATINGVLRTLDFVDRLVGLCIFLMISIPVTYFFLFRPIYIAREWIEKELKLAKRT
jgi:hypothetical protein